MSLQIARWTLESSAVGAPIWPFKEPNTFHRTTAEEMLNALGCAVLPRSAVYVSVPITTGRRYFEWSRLKGSRRESRRAAVVEPNLQAAADLVAAARRRFGTVIDPTSLPDVDGWVQSDYHAFWLATIQRFANTVVVADGWEYSVGCTLEATYALCSGIAVLNNLFRPLTNREASMALERSMTDMAVGRSAVPAEIRACASALKQA